MSLIILMYINDGSNIFPLICSINLKTGDVCCLILREASQHRSFTKVRI